MTPAHAGRDEHRIYCGGSGHSHRARDGVMLSHKSFSYFCTISSLAASGLVAMVSLHLPSSGQGGLFSLQRGRVPVPCKEDRMWTGKSHFLHARSWQQDKT